MFTVNRSSLRTSTIRRDYQFSTDHQKSYLTPDSEGNPDGNPNAYSNSDAAIDAAIDAASQADESVNDQDSDVFGTSDIDSPNPQSQETSIAPSDSASQTLPLIRPQPNIPARSWVYEHFSEVVIEGKLYTPSIGAKPQVDRRRCCKYCSFIVLDSNRHGTSGLSSHLARHGITKHHNTLTTLTTSIANLLMKAPASKKRKLSPEQSLVNWVADTFVPFVSVEHLSFH